MNPNHFLISGLFSILFAGIVHAQGSDDCATATSIAGAGTFNVSTVGSTDSSQQGSLCPTIHTDVWFRWTATQSGLVHIGTCGGTSFDTVIAAFTGSTCPVSGSLITCDDDGCGYQSHITFPATAGNDYLIQIGGSSPGNGYSGTFSIESVTLPTNDACSNAQALSGPGPFSFDTTLATTGTEGQTTGCGPVLGIVHDVWFSWIALASGAMEISSCGSPLIDSKIAVYAGPGCPSGPPLGCDDNGCGYQADVIFQAVAGRTYTIQVGSRPLAPGGSGSFTIAAAWNGCATPSLGPDVIVGDIHGVLNVQAASGVDAFAFGTSICNLGNSWVSCAPSESHPIVVTNLYRYQVLAGAGRIEHVGQSWARHSLFADSGNALCCTCNDTGHPRRLGPGCADPSDAWMNGVQTSLGPRWQVNASTGSFPYPPANPSWSGTTARRCEVDLVDLHSASVGARWFIEAGSIAADDASAGNDDNNESWKELTLTGSAADYSFTTTGLTRRMESGIEAWRTAEPGVSISQVDVPSDGRFIVGSHATPLGGGLWHYEYAVHNMNSDRNCGRFAVAIPSGVTVANIGFHDVSYRNGDGQSNIDVDGTDWAVTQSAGQLVWSTRTPAQDLNANAIRWGTTYNFRFDANAAPMNGTVLLDLWKVGTPGSVTAVAEIPRGAPVTFAVCFGDGSGTACPCGNNSPAGANVGCSSSVSTGGRLSSSGTPSISSDTFMLNGSAMPNAAALYFQGSSLLGGGAGVVFGDGLRCAGGSLVRLARKTNAVGSSMYPGPGDPPVSVRGHDLAGDVRTYQCWYRNAAAFCSQDTFNLTNAVQTTWQP